MFSVASLLSVSARPLIEAPNPLDVHLFFAGMFGALNTLRGLAWMDRQGILELEEEVPEFGDWDTENKHPRGEWIAQQQREKAKWNFANHKMVRDFMVGFFKFYV
ncbi:hypothetical protein HZB97_01055 [Candidatus Gottesmanbacteria bacterium]|nr:hypothetical protein [Candidatus Gottesmanbacteria bacterium]